MAGRTISKELKAQIVSAYRQGEKMKNISVVKINTKWVHIIAHIVEQTL